MDARHLSVAIFGAVCCLAATPASAVGSREALGLSIDSLDFVQNAIGHGYRAAPALMLGLGMLLAIPGLVVATRLLAWFQRAPEATRRYRARRDDALSDASDEDEGLPPLRSGRAFVEIVGVQNAHYALLRDMVRIGREDDNDIRISSKAVHRYHAAIHREDHGDYRITDLSGVDGNGVVVNGQRCSDARLNDGDIIELGPGRLRFHAGLM